MNTFHGYAKKSDAIRGFDRAFKGQDKEALNYLGMKDEKWGFFKSPEGTPVLPEVGDMARKPEDAGVLNDMAPASVVPDAALEAARDESQDEQPPAPDAFSRFAMGQLVSNGAPRITPRPVDASAPKIEKNRPESNGVKRPSAGTLCAQVWDIATGLTNPESNHIATLKEVTEAADKAGINKYTARTQYARWRVFHGIVGRLQN